MNFIAYKYSTIDFRENIKPAANANLWQWELMWFIESLCFTNIFLMVDILSFQDPPIRQVWKCQTV